MKLSNENLSQLLRSKFPELCDPAKPLNIRTVSYSGIINTDQILVDESTVAANPNLLNLLSDKGWRGYMMRTPVQLHGRSVMDTSYVVDNASRAGVSHAFEQAKKNDTQLSLRFNSSPQAPGVSVYYDLYRKGQYRGPEGAGTSSAAINALRQFMKQHETSYGNVYADRLVRNPKYVAEVIGYRLDGKIIVKEVTDPASQVSAQYVNDTLWGLALPIFRATYGFEPEFMVVKFDNRYVSGASGFPDLRTSILRNVNYNADEFHTAVLYGHDAYILHLYCPLTRNPNPLFSTSDAGIRIVGWRPGEGLYTHYTYDALDAEYTSSDELTDAMALVYSRIEVTFPNFLYSRLVGDIGGFTGTLVEGSLNSLQITLNDGVEFKKLGISTPEMNSMIASGRNIFGEIKRYNLLFGLPSSDWHVKGEVTSFDAPTLHTEDDISFTRSHVDVYTHEFFWNIDQQWYRDYYDTGFGVYTPRASNIQANVLKTWDEFKANAMFLFVTQDEIEFSGEVSELREARAYAKARARACKSNDFMQKLAAPNVTWAQLSSKEKLQRPRKIWMDAFTDTTFMDQYTFQFSEAVEYSKSATEGVSVINRKVTSDAGVITTTVLNVTNEDHRGIMLRDKYFNTSVNLNGLTWNDLIVEDAIEQSQLQDNEDLQGLTVNTTANQNKQIGFGKWVNPYTEALIHKLNNEQRYRLHLKNTINFDSMGKNFVKLFDSFSSTALYRKLGIKFI